MKDKVRKHPSGEYRVWCVEAREGHPFDLRPLLGEDRNEVRYATMTDAKDFKERMGGEMYYEPFPTREEAQAYMDEAKGVTWW